ncbi:MAG: polysaccharide biosynthesis protein, partial [Erysipelotrichia bacterium]|nr:polysaccharide biosynthesis protein [Erysipelotrichia bacterium]
SEVIVLIYVIASAKIYKYVTFSIDKRLIKEMLVYSLPLIPSSLSWWVMNASDKYMILYFVGVSANGLYSVAHKIPTVINLCNTLFMQAWQISAVEEANSLDKDDFYTKVFSLVSSFLYIIGAGLLLMIKPIMCALVAKSYGEVWKLSPFLVIAMIYSAFAGFMGTNYSAMKKTGGALKTTVAGAFTNVLLNYILIQKFGVNGAAFATMFSFIVMWLYRVIDTKDFVKIKFSWIKILLSNVILFLQSYVVIEDPKNGFVYLAVCVAIMLIVHWNNLRPITNLITKKIKKT